MRGRDDTFLAPGGALRGPLFASLYRQQGQTRTLVTGTLIGRYRIEQLIGRGGNGEVYRASRDDGEFSHQVALKVIRRDRRQAERFRHERNVLARLTHPGIARIHDGGETTDGLLWYAMELVEGERIDRWCQRRSGDWRQVLNLMRVLCEAVHHAHTHLVVHRDIKPSNILIDAHGQPRLLDFGICGSTDGDDQPGSTDALTPAFASPEQLAGAPVTVQSDIYQLGRLLECLDIVGDTAPPWLTRNLAAVIARATDPLPERRYRSVAELSADIERVLQARPSQARRWPLAWHLKLFTRRHRLPMALATLALLSIAGIGLYAAQQVLLERDRAEAQARHASTSAEVLASLIRMATAEFAPDEMQRLLALLDRTGEATLMRLGDMPGQQAIAATALIRTYRDIDQPERARNLGQRVLAALDQESGHWQEARAVLHRDLAHALLALGDADAAREQHRLAQEQLRQAGIDPAQDLDLQTLALALREHAGGDSPDVARDRTTLITRLEQAGRQRSPAFAALLTRQAHDRFNDHDLDGASASLDRAHALTAQHHGPNSRQALAVDRLRIQIALARGGQTERHDSRARIDRQADTIGASAGAGSAEFADVLITQGIAACEDDDMETGVTRFRQAHAALLALHGEQHPDTARAAIRLADGLQELDRAEEALPLYPAAIAVLAQRHGEDHLPLLAARLQQARGQCRLGVQAWAAEDMAQQRQRLGTFMAADHGSMVAAAIWHSQCLLQHGRSEEAQAVHDNAVAPFPDTVLTTIDQRRLQTLRRELRAAATAPALRSLLR